jgi:putative transposase
VAGAARRTDRFRPLAHAYAHHALAHALTIGTGHLYQGRFKSFPIEQDDHLFAVLRYVERNALRANLIARAEAWQWSSLCERVNRPEVELAA